MRKVIDLQMKIGEISIADIKFDLRSRDEIPKLLQGLQQIYCNREIREEVFEILKKIVPANINSNNGRPGMDLWTIFVLGTLRLCCNWDYDKLMEIANNHKTLRQMLGHGIMEQDYNYALQTLKDNVSLFTPEVLDEINQIVVKYGHKLVGKKDGEDLNGKKHILPENRIIFANCLTFGEKIKRTALCKSQDEGVSVQALTSPKNALFFSAA